MVTVAEGQRVRTPYGPGTLQKLDEGRAEVRLDWCLADGKAARAFVAEVRRCEWILELHWIGDSQGRVVYHRRPRRV